MQLGLATGRLGLTTEPPGLAAPLGLAAEQSGLDGAAARCREAWIRATEQAGFAAELRGLSTEQLGVAAQLQSVVAGQLHRCPLKIAEISYVI